MKNPIKISFCFIVISLLFSCSSENETTDVGEQNNYISKYIKTIYPSNSPSLPADSIVYFLSEGKIDRMERYSRDGSINSFSSYNYDGNGRLVSILNNGSSSDEFFEYDIDGNLSIHDKGTLFREKFLYYPNRIEVMQSRNNGSGFTQFNLQSELIVNNDGKIVESNRPANSSGNYSFVSEFNYNGSEDIFTRVDKRRHVSSNQSETLRSWNTSYTDVVNPVYEIFERTYGRSIKNLMIPVDIHDDLNYSIKTRYISKRILDNEIASFNQNAPLTTEIEFNTNGDVIKVRYNQPGDFAFVIEETFIYEQ